jgi:hypothetical protein
MHILRINELLSTTYRHAATKRQAQLNAMSPAMRRKLPKEILNAPKRLRDYADRIDNGGERKMEGNITDDETLRLIVDKYKLKWNGDFDGYDCDYDISVGSDILQNGKLLIRFANVRGNFRCNTRLTSLIGCPEYVKGNFDCHLCDLTSLKGAPKKVVGNFDCSNCKLTSLEGAPEEVWGDFLCHSNNLTTLVGAPEYVGGDFDCSLNQLKTLKGAPQEGGMNFNCSMNPLVSLKGAQASITGDFRCADCKLKTLEGAPQEVGGNFDCSGNIINSYAGKPKISGTFIR